MKSRWFIIILYFILNIQNYILFSFGPINVKLFHILTISLLVFLLPLFTYEKELTIPIAFFYIVAISSLYNTILGLLNPLFINYIFAFLVFISSFTLGKYSNFNKLVKALPAISWLIMAIVILNTIYYLELIISYISQPYGHPKIPTIYGGGTNLQGTFLALNGVFLRKHRSFLLYWFLSITISIMYSTRIGIILNLFLLILNNYHDILRLRNILIFTALAVIVIAATVKINPYAINRFYLIGSDTGSVTRLEMWKASSEIIIKKLPIIGYGAGNAITIIDNEKNIRFFEDNIHNYFLQVLVDFGFIGFLFWLIIVKEIFILYFRYKGDNVFANYLVLFIIASFIQFRGAEPLFWFVFGLLLSYKHFYYATKCL